MNARQTDELSMEKVVNSLLKQTVPAILAQMPEIEMLKTAFEENINTIDVLYNGQNLNRTGTRMTKDEYREEMTNRAFTTAARTCAYAISIGDEELQMKVTYVYTDFTELREAVVANTCKDIYDIALPLAAELEIYGISDASLSKLKDSIDLYREIQPRTREGIVTQTTFTIRIEELFEENEKLLFRIDKLVTMLRFDEANFFNEYFGCRKIIESGSRKFSIKGNITNELGQPIDQVYVVVEAPKEATTKTTQKGNYQLKGIEAGVWPVTFKRDGYVSERVFLVFTPNTRIDYNVKLKAVVEQERSA